MFSVLKVRFLIFNKGRRGYTQKTQVKIIWALTAVYNLLNQNGCNPHKDESGYKSEDNLDTDNCMVFYNISK